MRASPRGRAPTPGGLPVGGRLRRNAPSSAVRIPHSPWRCSRGFRGGRLPHTGQRGIGSQRAGPALVFIELADESGHDFLTDRKSTRLNSSHLGISYAVFCLKKKKKNDNYCTQHNNALICPTAVSDPSAL